MIGEHSFDSVEAYLNDYYSDRFNSTRLVHSNWGEICPGVIRATENVQCLYCGMDVTTTDTMTTCPHCEAPLPPHHFVAMI